MRPGALQRDHRLSALLILAIVIALVTACSTAGNATEQNGEAGDGGELIVFAATSLADAFTQLARSFEDENQATVTLQFAGSQVLSRQLIEGARADVFATADTITMDRVIDAGVTANPPEIFTQNVLALVSPRANPGGVMSLAALADDDLVVALCAVEVPCGRASAAVLTQLGIEASADTLEASVRSTLAKVVLGEADAALVYRSDAIGAADEVSALDLSATERAAIDANRQFYPIVVTTGADSGSARADLARDFVGFVLSDRGQQVLEDHGFGG